MYNQLLQRKATNDPDWGPIVKNIQGSQEVSLTCYSNVTVLDNRETKHCYEEFSKVYREYR